MLLSALNCKKRERQGTRGEGYSGCENWTWPDCGWSRDPHQQFYRASLCLILQSGIAGFAEPLGPFQDVVPSDADQLSAFGLDRG